MTKRPSAELPQAQAALDARPVAPEINLGARSAAALRGVGLAGLGLAAGLSVSAAPAQAAETGPQISTFKLENGLQGVVIEDHRAPVVTHMVWYRVGAADEPPGRSGIAHFLEHLMFKGTDEIPPGEFSKIIAANGGQDNAFTSNDYTAYFQRIAKDRLDLVMKMEADRMRDLVLDEESVVTERAVVIEERNSRTDNDPQSQFYEQFNATLYKNHPYGLPVIGWRREIEKLSLDDAIDFYKRFYGPDNAILVVAGDVDPEEVEALATAHYGAVEAADIQAHERPQEPPHLAARRVVMVDEKVRQPFLTRGYLTPSYVTAESGDAHALAVASEILGGGTTARLSKELVLGQKIALNAGAYYRGVSRDDTTFAFYVVPADGVSLEDAEAAADAALASLVNDGPSEAELERAKMVLISSSIFQQDSQSSMARMYGSALTVGLDIEDVRVWPDKIRAVSAEDVKRVLGELLKIEASVTGYLSAPERGASKTDAGQSGAVKQ
ncbi:MAG: insulinase family protein [Rhodobacteraceae bacterium]|nr:insulinase family protein [Paracoccaceae bacterium]